MNIPLKENNHLLLKMIKRSLWPHRSISRCCTLRPLPLSVPQRMQLGLVEKPNICQRKSPFCSLLAVYVCGQVCDLLYGFLNRIFYHLPPRVILRFKDDNIDKVPSTGHGTKEYKCYFFLLFS